MCQKNSSNQYNHAATEVSLEALKKYNTNVMTAIC